MLKYWFNRLRGRPNVLHYPARSVLIYRANGRIIELPGENLMDGFQIDLSAVMSWNDKPAEFLSQEAKLRVGKAAAHAAASQWGMKVVVGNAS
jgi:hypothetical protein